MEIKEAVENAVRQSTLELPAIELELTSSGKVGGFVISSTFKGMAQIDRQNLVWDHLDRSLPVEVRTRIVALLTLTPEEAEEPAA